MSVFRASLKEECRKDLGEIKYIIYRAVISAQDLHLCLHLNDFSSWEIESKVKQAEELYVTLKDDLVNIRKQIYSCFYDNYVDNWCESDEPDGPAAFKNAITLDLIEIFLSGNFDAAFDLGEYFHGHGVRMSVTDDGINYKLEG